MDDETSKPDLTRVLPIVEERASLHSVSKPDVRDELNSLSRGGAKIERKKLEWNLKWFLPEASSNHVSNPEELEARLDRELIRIVLFFSLFYSTHTHVEGPTLSALHLLSKFRISCPSPTSLHPSSAIGNGRSLNL